MHDAKVIRLKKEYEKLLKLARRSKFIQVEPVEVQPGYPPEKYLITYTCLGIARITKDGEPVPSEFHQVMMHLVDFPAKEPALKWVTDIWHPNIEHDGPRKVCTDNPKSWFPTKSLDGLVYAVGEMVQYKRYHARWKPPYPVDKEAAVWVLEYAEPKNIIGPDKPYDSRPLLPKMPLVPAGGAKPNKPTKPKVVFGNLKLGDSKPEPPQPDKPWVVFGKPK